MLKQLRAEEKLHDDVDFLQINLGGYVRKKNFSANARVVSQFLVRLISPYGNSNHIMLTDYFVLVTHDIDVNDV